MFAGFCGAGLVPLRKLGFLSGIFGDEGLVC